MNVGQLARLTGVSAHTLRFYERQGVLAPPRRAANGYRDYAPAHADRVRFLRGAQAMGFTLAEIRDTLAEVSGGRVDRVRVETLLASKLREIDTRVRELRQLKRDLQGTLARLRCPPGQPVSLGAVTVERAGGIPHT